MNLNNFKNKYVIEFDQEEFLIDSQLTNKDKKWFQYLPCKHGKIYLQDDRKNILQYFSKARNLQTN